MNSQMEGVNSNYRSAKFEEISPKKTGDVSHFFPLHNIRHRIRICQDRHLRIGEIPDHLHARAYLCLRSNGYLSEEIDGNLSRAQPRALRKKGHSLKEYLLHFKYGDPP